MKIYKDKRGFFRFIGVLLIVLIIFYLLYIAVDACLRQSSSGIGPKGSLIHLSFPAPNIQRIRGSIEGLFNR